MAVLWAWGTHFTCITYQFHLYTLNSLLNKSRDNSQACSTYKVLILHVEIFTSSLHAVLTMFCLYTLNSAVILSMRSCSWRTHLSLASSASRTCTQTNSVHYVSTLLTGRGILKYRPKTWYYHNIGCSMF